MPKMKTHRGRQSVLKKPVAVSLNANVLSGAIS